MNNLAPIIVFCYNRPWHLEQTLDALSRNELVDQSTLYIYCDGPKDGASEEQRQTINEVRQVARKRQWCKEVYVVEREENVGLMNNIVGAVTEIVNQYGRVITMEDDIITSKGYLRFMNEALELYKDDEQVMHISGYMWPHKHRLPDTFFYELPYPGGGWATWQRAWQHYMDDTKSLYDYWCTRWDEFNKFGDNYLQKQLEANYHGKMKTWFIKWHAVMLQRGALTLYPGQSLTNNIGFDDQATNCYTTDKFDVVPVDYVPVTRQTIKENKRAAREIYAFYQGRWYNRRRRTRLINKVLAFFHLPQIKL
jgi:hypothetical protein